MRIACTDCNAIYDLPQERVRPGRGVKCARCGTVWVPVALEDAEPEIPHVAEPPPAPPPPEPLPPEPEPVHEPTPIPEPPLPVAAPRASRIPVLLGWLLSLCVLAALAWGLWAYRDRIMEAWPPSERAYRLVGLHGGKNLAP